MKILIPCDDTKNAYIPSLVNAYQSKGCEVVVGVANFFQSNYCPDIVHIQWPESLYLFDDLSLYGDPLTIIPERIMHYKANRAVVIWTVHNINPHYSKNEKIDRLIYEKIIDMSDIIVHHGKISIELMKKNYEKIKTQKNIICPHGDYLIQYCPVDKEVAREKLEIPQDKTVLLSFGNIRNYDDLNVVRTVFSNWKNKKKFLLVAGKFNIGSEKFKQKIAKTWYKKLHKQSLNHKYDLKSISNCDVAYYFQAADIVIVSHKTGLTSGVLAMAGTFNKPIVYPELGNFSEQVDGLIAEKFQPNRPHEALNALQRIEAQITNLNEQRNESWLKRNSWKIHVDKILTSIASMNSIL